MRSFKADVILDHMKRIGGNGYYRENIFGKEVIFGKKRFVFTNSKGRNNSKFMYIFAMVKKDAVEYNQNLKKKIRLKNWNPSVYWNESPTNDERPIIGTDIDNAYWKIAFDLGIISEKTFFAGVSIPDKALLLASLSTLGSNKSYAVLKDGKPTGEYALILGSDELKLLYKLIRHTCFSMMKSLSKLLGNDFICYKTDCIYYKSSKQNKKIVKQFFDDRKINYKMLLHFDGDITE